MSVSTELTARIVAVHQGSPAERAGVLVGDVVMSVNGQVVRDIIEWHHAVDEASISLDIDRNGMPFEFDIEKRAGEQLGVEISSAVFDRVQTCDNHCSFCFIYQLPKNLRKSLYLKDDDYRLSFLFGNFTTLTRFTEADLERVLDQKLSPLHVSIHVSDPWKRADMLRNERGAVSLRWLKVLLENGIDVRGQIVVCPDHNNGEDLERTLIDILDQYPLLEAVAIVPLGLSQFNPEAELRVHTSQEAADVVALCEKYQLIAEQLLGKKMFWPSDEFYLLGNMPFPDASSYGGYPMYEDGVGIVSSFVEEFQGRKLNDAESLAQQTSGFFASVDGATPGGYRSIRDSGIHNPAGDTGLRVVHSQPVELTRRAPSVTSSAGKVGILTGAYAASVISGLVSDYGDRISVLPVVNNYFGGNTAVSGLMVGEDIRSVMLSHVECDVFLLPDVCLSEGRFLDGMTLEDLPSSAVVLPTDGHALRNFLEKVMQ